MISWCSSLRIVSTSEDLSLTGISSFTSVGWNAFFDSSSLGMPLTPKYASVMDWSLYAGVTPIFAMAAAPLGPDAQVTNFVAALAFLAFLLTANAVGEPNVVALPFLESCGIGAMPQSTFTLPALMSASSAAAYHVPIGSMAVFSVPNIVWYAIFCVLAVAHGTVAPAFWMSRATLYWSFIQL